MSTNINRRGLIAMSIGAAGIAALPTIPTVAADPQLEGLSGLTLAAVHIERAVQAMADVEMGHWSVQIFSGDASQSWAFHQEYSRVRRAISRHKRCRADVNKAVEQVGVIEEKLHAKPTYDIRPRVQVGVLLKGRDDAGEEVREPIYAYNLATVDRYSEQMQAVYRGWRPDNELVAKERFDAKREQLRKAIARNKRMEQQAGLPAARRAVTKAYEAEERAAVALLMAKPRNASEAEEKRSYLGKECITDPSYWDVERLLDAVLWNAEGGNV